MPQPNGTVDAGAGQQLTVGANATATTPVWVPAWMGAPAGWPVAGFHSRTLPSVSALASSLPSGLNAAPGTPYRKLLVAWMGATAERPVAGCHSHTVPSPQPAASSVPSGLNATH